MRDIIVVGDPLISDGRSGNHRTNTVIKHISGQTGANLWFHHDTRGFSVANYKCKKTYQFKTHCMDNVMISLH